jgi:hypothetical protein
MQRWVSVDAKDTILCGGMLYIYGKRNDSRDIIHQDYDKDGRSTHTYHQVKDGYVLALRLFINDIANRYCGYNLRKVSSRRHKVSWLTNLGQCRK